MNAVNAFQQGTAWKQQQGEIARAQEQRAALDEANAAATGVITQSQSEWAANGAQGQYRPSETTLFKAAEARGMALAKRGRWDEFIQNEAQVAPMRVKARATALQQYETDGDADKLARTVYPTLFDGKEIVGSEKIEGADGSVNLGLAARPSKLKLKLSDGSTKELAPDELVKMVKTSLIDPQAAMKNEALLNLERAKAQIKTAEQIAVEEVKGKEARLTEGVKSKNAVGLQGVKFGHETALHAADNTAAQTRAETLAGSRKEVATIKASDVKRGAAGGLNGSNYASKTVLADGRVLIHFRDGSSKVATTDDGTPITAIEFEKLVGSAAGTVGKSMDGLSMTAQQQRETARGLLPKQPAGGGKKDYGSLWGEGQ